MVIATQHFLRAISGIMTAFAAAVSLFVTAETAHAQEAAGVKNDGLFISVPQEITSAAVSQIKLKVQEAVSRRGKTAAAFTGVFDFNPNGHPSGSSSFGSCMALGYFIR